MNFNHAKRLMSCAVAMLAAGLACAQSGDGAWRVDTFYASSYVSRGVERANASAQATLDYTQGNFRATAWTNHPFSGEGHETREFNLSAAYSHQLTQTITLEFVASHAWFADVPGGGVDRSCELGVNATFAAATVGGFTPTLGVYHDFRFEADTAQLAFARSIPLTKLGTFLELNFFAGWSAGRNWRPDAPGPKRRDDYGYWGGEVRVPYQVGRFAVIAGLHYADTTARSTLSGPFGGDSEVNFWATLGVSLEF